MSSPIFKPAYLFSVALPILAVASWFAFSNHPLPASAATAATSQRQPVLVELFTSEGCSDCPPADALLARLDSTQFVPGAQAIVLSEHVTYWNNLGWRDPFSSDAMTKRQERYAAHFGLESVYTPQAVVDGAAELVGSDGEGLRSAVGRAAASPKADLSIENVQWTGNTVQFAVRSSASSRGKLTAALAEDATQSSVARGENAGRTLHHVAVVRDLEELGADAADGRPLTLQLPGASQSGPTGKSASMRLVVFLTDRHTGRVLAVAEHSITQ